MNFINFVGVGKVTAMKQTNTGEITVFLSSKLPFADGEVVPDAEHKQQVTKTAKGDDHTSNVLESSNVPAIWFNIGQPNRITPPDVSKGSTVAIYQIGNQDMYRWTTFGVDTVNMALETVIFGYSANPNRDQNKPFNYDDYYIFEVSPRTGKVSLRTSQANGEQARYELALDTMKARLLFADSLHNVFGFDSLAHHIFMTNEEKSLFEIKRDTISAICTGSLLLSADQLMTLKSALIEIICDEFKMTAPKWSINGEGTIDGDVHFTKGIRVDGIATGSGGGAFQVSDFKTSSVVSYNGHKHRENGEITSEPING